MPVLRSFDIGYNQLNKLNTSLFSQPCETVESLVLAGNLLSVEVLTLILQTVKKLQTLSLADIKLRTLPLKLNELRYLKFLNVSGNTLSNRDELLRLNLNNVQNLDVSRNCFLSLSEGSLLRVDNISNVSKTVV